MPNVNNDMIQACPDGSIFFDIGANHGWVTLEMAHKPRSKVYAFEPEPDNLKTLRDVLRDQPNVEIHGIALSDYNGVGKLMLHPGNPGGHSMEKALENEKYHHTLGNSIDVAVLTLDTWCQHNGIKRVDGIKIDVEAHEESVLRGAIDTLKKYHPVIALETHHFVNFENVTNILTDCEYSVREKLEPDKGYFLRREK